MPGAMQASGLIAMTRDLINHQSPNVFRDGYATDADTDGIPILRWLNQSYNELLPTGFCKCWLQFTTVPGKSEYTLDEGAHEIQHVLINGMPLHATSFLGLDQKTPAWQDSIGSSGHAPTIRTMLPTQYYSFSDQIGLVPFPDQAYDVYYLADAFPSDLLVAADVPTRLPVRYHSTLAVRAAWWLSNIDVENEVAAKRLPALDKRWEKDYADLQALVNHRMSDLDDQIQAGDYRKSFYWGHRY